MSGCTPGGSLIYTTKFNRYEAVWGRDENGHIFANEWNVNDPRRPYPTIVLSNLHIGRTDAEAIEFVREMFIRGGMSPEDAARVNVEATS